MIATKKAIARRTILRGLGATVALPLLDAMIPALTAAVNTPAKPIRRLGVVYHPNGIIYDKWLPTGVGADFELSPTLAGLQPFRDKLIVVTGLSMDQAEALGDGGGDHSRACGGYLNGVHVRKSDTVVEAGMSMDQIAARAFERDTQLSSLQLQMDENSIIGSCDVGYSCAYSSTISWLTPTLPLMTENNPRVVFERLFGASDSTDPKVRAARLHQDRSILDSVTDRVKQLQRRELGFALERLRGNLVHRHPGFDDGIGFPDMHAAQIPTARAGMIAAAVSQGFCLIHEEACYHDQLVSKRLQAGKCGRELEIGAHALRQPFVVNDAVWMVDDAEAADRFRRCIDLRRERRNHGVEQWQCHGRAHPAKNRSARDRLLGHYHEPALLIRNGALFTSARIVDDQR